MFVATLTAALSLLGSQADAIVRVDSYGVSHIKAPSANEAFREAGHVVGMDRLWQIELSRRTARGRMAEIFGTTYVASDTEVLATGYTDQELQTQFEALSEEVKGWFRAYAQGVNDAIEERTAKDSLPPGYKENGFEPEKWSILDSVAIAVKLFQTFGQGGAGELRNLALLKYLQARPNKQQALDIFDDFLWTNSPTSPTTVAKEDDLVGSKFIGWPKRSRAITESHLAKVPNVGIGELLPAIKIAMREEQNLVAELVSAPYKAGSYAIVVAPKRSATGDAMLLSAPQMGHRTPAIIHEMSISSPQYAAVGMDVPGVPGISIGHTATGAWALTSGVADTTDIFFSKTTSNDQYLYDGKALPLQKITRTLKIKGQPDRVITQFRTQFGPVILRSQTQNAVFSQRSTFFMKELQSIRAMFDMARAKSIQDVESALKHATVSFNCHYALNTGDIGYRFVGHVPIRAEGVDPRLPTPGEPNSDWKGIISYDQMPHMMNPRSGLITNWNNKPVAWWENADTPVWGRTFRIESLRRSLPNGLINLSDVEMGAWWIARQEPVWGQLQPILAKNLKSGTTSDGTAALLKNWDGRNFNGTPNPVFYAAFEDALRNELFMSTTGNFLSPSTFKVVTQQSVILQALEGKTIVDYRKGRTISEIFSAALTKAQGRLTSTLGDIEKWQFEAGSIAVPGQAPIPYSDRGSYIQVITLPNGKVPVGRNVVYPGVAESGPHSQDQVPLARAWGYKAMGF